MYQILAELSIWPEEWVYFTAIVWVAVIVNHMIGVNCAVLNVIDGRWRGEIVVVKMQSVHPCHIGKVFKMLPFIGGEQTFTLAFDAVAEMIKVRICMVIVFFCHSPYYLGILAIK